MEEVANLWRGLPAILALQLHALGDSAPERAGEFPRLRLHSSLGAGSRTAEDGWEPLGAGAALFRLARNRNQAPEAGPRHGVLPACFAHCSTKPGRSCGFGLAPLDFWSAVGAGARTGRRSGGAHRSSGCSDEGIGWVTKST